MALLMQRLINSIRQFLFALSVVFLMPVLAISAPVGEIDFIQGEVTIERLAGEFAAKQGDTIDVGDTLVTGDKSRVRILFTDHSSMQLGSHARSSIKQYTSSDEGIIDSLLELAEGRARFIVNKIKSSDSKYQIKMRTVLIGVRGTDILAQAESSVEHIALVEGRVALSDSSAGEIFLNKGHYIQTQNMALPNTSASIPSNWLMAFMQDVGSSKQLSKTSNQSDEIPASNLSTDAVQQKTSKRMAVPSIISK